MCSKHENVANRPWRTIAVAVLGLILAVQGYFALAIDPEPYPAIRMPGFSKAPSKDGTFGTTVARADVVFRDGNVLPISPTELMSQFRFSTAQPSYDYLFKSNDASLITPAVKEWLRRRIGTIHGAGLPVELRMCWQDAKVGVVDATLTEIAPCEWKSVTL
jgi:hypothetical protein